MEHGFKVAFLQGQKEKRQKIEKKERRDYGLDITVCLLWLTELECCRETDGEQM